MSQTELEHWGTRVLKDFWFWFKTHSCTFQSAVFSCFMLKLIFSLRLAQCKLNWVLYIFVHNGTFHFIMDCRKVSTRQNNNVNCCFYIIKHLDKWNTWDFLVRNKQSLSHLQFFVFVLFIRLWDIWHDIFLPCKMSCVLNKELKHKKMFWLRNLSVFEVHYHHSYCSTIAVLFNMVGNFNYLW